MNRQWAHGYECFLQLLNKTTGLGILKEKYRFEADAPDGFMDDCDRFTHKLMLPAIDHRVCKAHNGIDFHHIRNA